VGTSLVKKWPREFRRTIVAVIDKGVGLNVEVQRSVHGHKREHGDGVEYEPPLDALLSAMDGVEERRHTLEEQQGEQT